VKLSRRYAEKQWKAAFEASEDWESAFVVALLIALAGARALGLVVNTQARSKPLAAMEGVA